MHTPGHISDTCTKKAAESDARTIWWIKGDDMCVVNCLGTYLHGQWSRDVDLNDGKLNR